MLLFTKKLFLVVLVSLFCIKSKAQYEIVADTARTKHLVQMYSAIYRENFETSKSIALQYCRNSSGAIDYPFMRGLLVSCSNLGQIDTSYFLIRQVISAGEYGITDRLCMDFQLGPLLQRMDSVTVWQREIDSLYFRKCKLYNPAFNRNLAEEILDIFTDDQWPRYFDEQFSTDTTKHYNRDSALVAWIKTDSINQIRTGKIFDEYGWPTPELVGYELVQAIWFPLQHGSIEFQKKYKSLAHDSYKKGQLIPSSYAGLVDRLAVNQGKKQLYGTQFMLDPSGNYIPCPIKRKIFLKRRQRKMGMEYTGTIDI